MNTMHILKHLAVSALLLALCACVSGFQSHEPAAQTYLLQPPPATAGTARASATLAAGASLRVLQPLADPGLETDAIAVLRPGQRLDYFRAVRWAATVPSMLQSLAVEALRAHGSFGLLESGAGPFATEYVLSLEVRDFEARYASAGAPPTVHVALVCTLGRAGSGAALASFLAQSSVQASANRMHDVIAAFQRATSDVMVQLAGKLAPPPGIAPSPGAAPPAGQHGPAQPATAR